jgi:hypothetical protein
MESKAFDSFLISRARYAHSPEESNCRCLRDGRFLSAIVNGGLLFIGILFWRAFGVGTKFQMEQQSGRTLLILGIGVLLPVWEFS